MANLYDIFLSLVIGLLLVLVIDQIFKVDRNIIII